MKKAILTFENYSSELLIKIKRLKFTHFLQKHVHGLDYARKVQTYSQVNYVIPGEPVLHKSRVTSEASDGEVMHSWRLAVHNP